MILISWRHIVPKYVRDEYKNKTGKVVDKFGNTVETATETKKASISLPIQSSNKPKTSELTTKESYKPSGKFIYDKDV